MGKSDCSGWVRFKIPAKLVWNELFKNLSVWTDLQDVVNTMTFNTCHGRLVTTEEISGQLLDVALVQPKKTYDPISKPYQKSATTRKGILTAVRALFWHNPESVKFFKPKYSLCHPKNYLFILSKKVFLGSKYPKNTQFDSEKTSLPRIQRVV